MESLKPEAHFARVALEMKYKNPRRPNKQSSAQKNMPVDGVWEGSHCMQCHNSNKGV